MGARGEASSRETVRRKLTGQCDKVGEILFHRYSRLFVTRVLKASADGRDRCKERLRLSHVEHKRFFLFQTISDQWDDTRPNHVTLEDLSAALSERLRKNFNSA